MPDTIKALFGLFLDPIFTSASVIAAVAAIVFVKGRKTRSRGGGAALIALFVPAAALSLFMIIMSILHGLAP
jgi:hypothetical protein